MEQTALAVGDHLRRWRRQRRMSQLDLACEAEISARHLSFLETGRSSPSREMVLHLCDSLDVPRRERNLMLLAAGYAPLFSERALDDPDLSAAQQAVAAMLEHQKPYPAFAVDRGWNIVANNGALPQIYDGVADFLMASPLNAIRLSLHPEGLARRTLNLTEWSGHMLARLKHQVELTGDPGLAELLAEVRAYPGMGPMGHGDPTGHVAIPLRLATSGGELSFISTVMVFGSPVDITLSELTIECFFPADTATASRVKAMTPASSASAGKFAS